MIAYTLVDALTEHVFEGAPCAVCMWDIQRPNRLMQSIATELAVPDTVFLSPAGPGTWNVNFFNPFEEDEMSAHAILAAAHTVLGVQDVGFFESSGHKWKVTRQDSHLSVSESSQEVSPCAMPQLLESFGWETPVFVGQTNDDWWIECRTIEDVDHIVTCDQGVLKKLLSDTDKKGLVVTAEHRGDVVARHMIKRGWRIVERPIAARAYRALLPFWCERLHVDQLTLASAHIEALPEGDIRLSGPCVDSFVGTFMTVQGQISLGG